jgi:hypothetical protein
MRRMLREVLFVRDERADRCLLVLCLFFVMLFYLLLSGGPKIPKIKVSNSKVSNSKVSNSKVSNSLLTFHRKESNCLLRDCLVSFCETLLCVERLACIFEIIGPLHIISHEHRQKQTTNRGLSAGLCCRVSCFPVWCDERRRQTVVCPPVYAAGLAISPCGAGERRLFSERFIFGGGLAAGAQGRSYRNVQKGFLHFLRQTIDRRWTGSTS